MRDNKLYVVLFVPLAADRGDASAVTAQLAVVDTHDVDPRRTSASFSGV